MPGRLIDAINYRDPRWLGFIRYENGRELSMSFLGLAFWVRERRDVFDFDINESNNPLTIAFPLV